MLFQSGGAGSHLAIGLPVRGLALGGNMAVDWRCFTRKRRPADVAD